MPVIGMATSNFFLVKDVYEAVKFARDNEFSGVEIWSDVPHCYVDDFTRDKEQWSRLHTLLTESKMKSALHAPMFGINIASVNHGIRKESIRQVKASIDLAHTLGSEIVVFHSGKRPAVITPSRIKELTFNLNIDAILAIKNYAREKKVYAILENCGVDKDDYEESLSDFVHLVETCKIDVCWDVGHSHCSWGVKETFESLKKKIRHIHIHDNDRSYDQHLPVGMGNIDYQLIFPFLKEFPGMIVHEIQSVDNCEEKTVQSKKELDKLLR